MTLVFKQSVETNKEALCVKLGSDRGIMRDIGGQMGVNFFKSLHRFTVVYT